MLFINGLLSSASSQTQEIHMFFRSFCNKQYFTVALLEILLYIYIVILYYIILHCNF
jgi:hypothetical protein